MWRAGRDQAAVDAALDELRRAAATRREHHAGDDRRRPGRRDDRRVGGALRDVFGYYRAPTGVGEAAAPAPRRGARRAARRGRARSEALGRTLKILVGKPGLDGHSNGAEQIAVRARDAGMDVVYEGIRLTPAQIARRAVDEGVHVIGLSILSGSHRELIPDVIDALARPAAATCRRVGGIIPDADARAARGGRRAVYTPKDFELTAS